MYYQLEPEVAGGWGDGTEADTTCHPPKVKKLVYEFDGWLGDSIVTSFPCYLVTEELAQSVKNAKLSGYELASCKITKSEIFNELYPNRKLPMFLWFKVVGKAGVDDFGIGANLRLVVSDAALTVLKEHSINGSEIEEINV
ncbi:hypothetical protein [uncultured Tolumonas sp.]|uniref:hypothetical protein n=1 Tax=uncultured Tolumonas sp. TaxID=263765 RepID=UPI00292E7566|nr:hypothetical protein [uncultured Tolumonas sp.]